MVNSPVAVIGVVGLAIGLALGFGLFGPLAVTCVSNCSGQVHPDFTWNSTQTTAYLTDHSTKSGGAIVAITISWGDGSNSTDTSSPAGHMFLHTYAKYGNYTVKDAVTGRSCGGGMDGVHCQNSVAVAAGTIDLFSTSSSCQSNCGSKTTTVNASFSWKSTNLTLSLTDTTQVTGSPSISTVDVAWGDGNALTKTALGFSAQHNYTASGLYNISETVYFNAGNLSTLSTYTQEVTVESGVQNQSQNTSAVQPLFAFSALSGFLVIGFAGLAVAAVIPGVGTNPKILAIVGITVLVVGALVGFAAGGGKVL